jgi:hypothetical protein
MVTELLKLAPTGEQIAMLEATMGACNAAADRVAEVAFELRTANKIVLQKMVYADLRADFEISSQMAVRAIAKACEAYKRDKSIRATFRSDGAVQYDQRMLTWKGRDAVSILTLSGRIIVPVVYEGRWTKVVGAVVRGQADLIVRDGKWYLAVVVEVPEAPGGGEPVGWLGVDLGVVNLATEQRRHRLQR